MTAPVKFILSDFEFGEVYHVAVAKILSSQQIHINISRCSTSQKDFLQSIFGTEGLEYNQVEEQEYRGCSHKEKLPLYEGYKKNLPEATKLITANWKEDSSARYIYERFTENLPHDKARAKISAFLKSRLLESKEDKIVSRVMIHVRGRTDLEPDRNLNTAILTEILRQIRGMLIKEIIITGDELSPQLHNVLMEANREDLKFYFWNAPYAFFNNPAFADNPIASQIFAYKTLQNKYGLKHIFGMKSGSLDGPAFIGIPVTFYEQKTPQETDTKHPPRMKLVSEKIENLTRVVFKVEYSYSNVTHCSSCGKEGGHSP